MIEPMTKLASESKLDDCKAGPNWSFVIVWLFMLFTMSPVQADDHSENKIVEQYAEDADRLNERLAQIYGEVAHLTQNQADESQYAALIDEMKSIKNEKETLQEKWRKTFADEASGGDENYALWDMGETTLSQLIMEYGASDYLYIIPPELSAMKISLYSSIPLPRESWEK